MEKLFDRIVENAVDFLNQSVDGLEQKPKYSIIHFCSSIELFLKARLAADHWSLIVSAKQVPDMNKVKKGDFLSVNLKEAADKLNKTLGVGLSKEEFSAFEIVFNHRNKVVHFFHRAHVDGASDQTLIREVVIEQLQAWYYLHSLLTTKWRDVFEEKQSLIHCVNSKMKHHSDFLTVIYDNKISEISNEIESGKVVTRCPICHFESLIHESKEREEFYRASCKVCDYGSIIYRDNCPECESEVMFMGEGVAECPNPDCGNTIESDFLVDKVADHYSSYRAAKEGYCHRDTL